LRRPPVEERRHEGCLQSLTRDRSRRLLAASEPPIEPGEHAWDAIAEIASR
jgi:hypothetical protein